MAQLGTTAFVCGEDWQNTQKSGKQPTQTIKPAKAGKSCLLLYFQDTSTKKNYIVSLKNTK